MTPWYCFSGFDVNKNLEKLQRAKDRTYILPLPVDMLGLVIEGNAFLVFRRTIEKHLPNTHDVRTVSSCFFYGSNVMSQAPNTTPPIQSYTISVRGTGNPAQYGQTCC